MSLLTSSDLTYMRSTEETAMASTAVIYSPSYSSGALGNQVESWVATGTVSCDIWPIIRNKEEKSSGNQELSEGLYYVSVPYNTVVNVSDLLEIDSISYEVTFVPKAMSWLTNLRLEARNYNNQSKNK